MSDKESTQNAKNARRSHFLHIRAVIARGVRRDDFSPDILRAIVADIQPPNHRNGDDSYHAHVRKALPPDGSDELLGLYLRYCDGSQRTLLGRLRHDAMSAFARADMEARQARG